MSRTVFGGREKRDAMRGQRKAPRIPEPMDVMLRRAMGIAPMWSSVRAKSTAVPVIVAIASERRNLEGSLANAENVNIGLGYTML
jgi:hypothetical protein